MGPPLPPPGVLQKETDEKVGGWREVTASVSRLQRWHCLLGFVAPWNPVVTVVHCPGKADLWLADGQSSVSATVHLMVPTEVRGHSSPVL